MYVRGEQVGLGYQVGTIVIQPDGGMTVLLLKGYMLGESLKPTESSTITFKGADADAILKAPHGPEPNRKDDLERAIYEYLIGNGTIVGTITVTIA